VQSATLADASRLTEDNADGLRQPRRDLGWLVAWPLHPVKVSCRWLGRRPSPQFASTRAIDRILGGPSQFAFMWRSAQTYYGVYLASREALRVYRGLLGRGF
jgi:hypothetical protein